MKLQERVSSLRELGPRSAVFFSEVWIELKKVHWPSRNETYGATMVVVGLTILSAAFLGLVDLGLSYLMRAILS